MSLFVSVSMLVLIQIADGGNSTQQGRELPDHKRLYADLMANYGSQSVRPVKNSNEPIEVKFYYKPFILSEFDEQLQRLSITGTLYMGWVDEGLKWNPDDYGGVERLSLRMADIWIPDITAYERLDVGSAHVNIFEPYAIVNSSGYIHYFDLSDITVYCRLQMTLFPFDTQSCTIVFGSYSYDSDQFSLKYENSSAAKENRFLPNGVWKLNRFTVEEVDVLYLCCPKPYVEIHYAFYLERIGSFYIYSLWIPSGLLSSMIIAVFVMHPNSGEKVSLSVSNVLAFVLFQQIVVGSMPRSGEDSPIIVALFSAMIAISCLSVLASAIVLRVYHHNPKKPIPKLFRCLIFKPQTSKPNLTGETNGAYTNSPEEDGTKINTPVAIISANDGDVIKDPTTQEDGHVNRVVQDHKTRRTNSVNNYEETDWMILALVLDKIFLATAVCALLGTLMFCGISYAIQLAGDQPEL